MKKNYLKPIAESVTLESTWNLCTGSPDNNNITGGPGSPDGAPKRRVF